MILNKKWQSRFIDLAEHVAQWSKDPSTKVGAVIVNHRNRKVLGMGYNGFPRGVSDTQDRYEDRERKYVLVVHAEMNAILNCSAQLGPEHAMFVTLAPCCECAKAIIQSGIKSVVTNAINNQRWAASNMDALSMFEEAGVGVYYIGE